MACSSVMTDASFHELYLTVFERMDGGDGG